MTQSMHHFGPFEFIHGPLRSINGRHSREWKMKYGSDVIAERTIFNVNVIFSELIETFAQDRSNFVDQSRRDHGPHRVDLVDETTGDTVAYFDSFDMCGMTPGLINDSSRMWLCSADRRYSRSVASQQEYASIVARHEAPELGWVTGLLPDAVLSPEPSLWEPPSNWHIRHVVGVGSFTGVSGATAAELVGVTPQNFRKYTATDSASTHQKMSFAMWHALLHRLGVQRMPEGLGATRFG
ncbi:hypothetical protein [Delftia acidovorans]|uniref:hypothetical protein n=1 Tax=Delftia acidovorans TaxID=80866 RepID=UPI0028EAF572|nr:hypothetical protein [Delftia acidovorans]